MAKIVTWGFTTVKNVGSLQPDISLQILICILQDGYIFEYRHSFIPTLVKTEKYILQKADSVHLFCMNCITLENNYLIGKVCVLYVLVVIVMSTVITNAQKKYTFICAVNFI